MYCLFSFSVLALAQPKALLRWRSEAVNTRLLPDSQFAACYNLGRYYMNHQPDSLVYFGEMAYKIAQQYNLDYVKGKSLGLLGIGHYMKEAYVDASIFIKRAIKDKYLSKDSMAVSSQYNNLGLAYNELKLYTDAINAFQNAIHYSNDTSQFSIVSINFNIAVTLLYSLKNHKDALKYFRHCLFIKPDSEENKNLLGQAFNGIGVIFMDFEKQQDSAMVYFEKALSTFSETQIYQRNLAVFNQGICSYKAQQFNAGLNYLNSLKAYYISTELFASLQSLHETKAKLFFEWKKYRQMKIQLDSALLVTQTYQLPPLVEVHQLLSDYYIDVGDYKEALMHTKKAQSIEDSVAAANNVNQINTLRATIEEERLDNENASLQVERDVIAAKSYRQSLIQYLLILLATVFLGLIFMFYLRLRDKSRLSKKLKLLNADLAAKGDELQQLNRKKDQLFGILSHDLSTPLMAFEGITKAASQQATAAEDSKFKETTTQMHAHASALRQTLNNILAWSKNEQGISKPMFRAVLLHQLLQNALQLYSLPISQQNIKLVLEVDSDTLIFADKGGVETVLRNVINNAVKHTHHGALHIWSETQSEHIILHIVDTGTGITAEVLGKIQSGNNLGLGLHLCQTLMAQNNGTIQLKSEAGQGTEVLLQFVPYIV